MANIWFQEFFESLFRHALLRTYLGCHLVEVTESNLLVFVDSNQCQSNRILSSKHVYQGLLHLQFHTQVLLNLLLDPCPCRRCPLPWRRMETMAALARTAPPLAGSSRRPSCALRPTASLSFGAASTTPRGRLGLGLSTSSAGSVRAAGARAVPRRKIVASSVGAPAYLV